MSEKKILDAYKNALEMIEKNGLDYYKSYIAYLDENKNISTHDLIIATSLISAFELIEKN